MGNSVGRSIGAWACLAAMALIAPPAAAAGSTLAAEPLGQIAELPSPYPDHWLIVHDIAFNHMREGKLFIVDPNAAGGGQIKGILSADFIASFLIGPGRGEFYVVETFHSRGGRGGDRTDVVTIYNPTTLNVEAEIEIPPKRLTGVPNRFQTALTGDERFLLVYNFTPSQSVTVVDLDARRVVGEVPLPGCAFTIPTGPRGFLSLCSDGSARSILLGDEGMPQDSVRIAPFIDVDHDAVMEKPAIVGGIAYFPTFTGNMVAIDVRTHPASLKPGWSLTSDDERKAGWRPGGAWPMAADAKGRLYVLMHGHGAEGTHKDGGDQVWVFDAASGAKQAEFPLREWGLAIAVADTDPATIVVTGAAGSVDLYRPDGEHRSTLDVQMAFPMLVHDVAELNREAP